LLTTHGLDQLTILTKVYSPMVGAF